MGLVESSINWVIETILDLPFYESTIEIGGGGPRREEFRPTHLIVINPDPKSERQLYVKKGRRMPNPRSSPDTRNKSMDWHERGRISVEAQNRKGPVHQHSRSPSGEVQPDKPYSCKDWHTEEAINRRSLANQHSSSPSEEVQPFKPFYQDLHKKSMEASDRRRLADQLSSSSSGEVRTDKPFDYKKWLEQMRIAIEAQNSKRTRRSALLLPFWRSSTRHQK